VSDLSPPWVLFIDKGKPKAILPAMRQGEVADVSHMTMAEAQNIVRLGNELYHALVAARFKSIEARLRELVEMVKHSTSPALGDDEAETDSEVVEVKSEHGASDHRNVVGEIVDEGHTDPIETADPTRKQNRHEP
jgi:hypothetical protein